MKQLVLILLTLVNLNCFSQEQPSTTLTGTFNVYPVDTVGVVLLNRNMLQLSSGELALEYQGLDQELNPKWKNMYPFSKGMSPVFQEVNSQGIVLLFADRSGKKYELIKANTEYGDYERFTYQFSDRVQVSEVETYYDHVWLTGSIGNNPVLFRLKADNSFETVPTGAPGAVKFIGQTKFNKESQSLDFLILSSMRNKDALVWRSINLNGNVLQNEILSSFDKKRVKSIKATYSKDVAHIAGTYSNGTKTKIDGLFWGSIGKNRNGLKFNVFKSLSALTMYRETEQIEANGFEDAKERKFRSPNMSVFIDGLSINSQGELLIGLEIFKPEYRSRGALEREFIARDRNAQIDQNIYGRQGGLGLESGRDFEGRIDRASATDQLQIRYMNQSLSKAVNQGISYNHTAYLRVANDLELIEGHGVSFDLVDFGNLAKASHFEDEGFRYSFENNYQEFDLSTKEFSSLSADEKVSLVDWTDAQLLGISYDKETQKMSLSVKRLN